jgi:hypothetical protein
MCRDGTCDFKDNKIEPSTVANSGETSLKFTAVPPASFCSDSGCKTSKSAIFTTLLFFETSDDVWISGNYFVEKGMPSTIMDLESSYVQEGAGIRLAINSNDQLYVELKAVDKPSWKQETPIKFPKNQWVHVKAHYTLIKKRVLFKYGKMAN